MQKNNKNKNETIFTSQIIDGTIITGGHFMLTNEGTANLNLGTINSFDQAVCNFKAGKDKKIKVSLGILINNMGSVCDTKKKVCVLNPEDLKGKFTLPEEYLEILKKYGVKENEVTIYWEKSLRNKGKKELHKKIEDKEQGKEQILKDISEAVEEVKLIKKGQLKGISAKDLCSAKKNRKCYSSS